MQIAARQSFLTGRAGPPLPYDAEVEYLDIISPGYIDTGIFVDTDLVVTLDAAFLPSCKNLGALAGSNGDTCGYIRYRKTASPPYSDIMSSNGSGGFIWRNMGSGPTDRHLYQFGGNGLWTDGARRYATPTFPSATNYTIKLAGYNDGNTSNQGSCRFWRVTLARASNVRDYIPVRVGSGTSARGFLYDRVSGALFGNAADGGNGFPASCVGPDKTT